MDQTVQASDFFTKLKDKISSETIPELLQEKLSGYMNRLERLSKEGVYDPEFERDLTFIDFVMNLPFQELSTDILDIHRAEEILNKNHYGLKSAKDRILEYLSVVILNNRLGKSYHSQVLAFVGLVGSGKTSLAYSIAEALGRKIIRIPFGGLGSVEELRGQSRMQSEAEAGLILKSIHDAGVCNPVILLDEIDRVSERSRSDVMGVLIELLDPEQNWAFVDHYVDYPFDLSKVLFLATANNLTNVATAVLDRLEVIEMPAYTDAEKIVIGRDFILPKAIKDAGLEIDIIKIDEGLWPKIVRPLGFDAGIRSLQRNISAVVRKVAREVVSGNPGPYFITAENIEQYVS